MKTIDHIRQSLHLNVADYCLENRMPWITFNAIEYLNSLDLKGKYIFEYGSGGSTLFWLEKEAIVTSIEHDVRWAKIMKRYIGPYGSNIDIKCITPEKIDVKDTNHTDPNSYTSKVMRGYNFKNYVTQIDLYPDNFFDIVSIDGRARPSCIMHSYSKVKKGGILVVDDATRSYYFEKTKKYLDRLIRKEFSGIKPIGISKPRDIYSKTVIYIRDL